MKLDANSKTVNLRKGDGSMAVYGSYIHTLDSANRLIIPSKFRDALGMEIILYNSTDGCIFVYNQDTFDAVLDEHPEWNDTDEDRLKLRRILKDLKTATVDRNGRFVVPTECIEFAGLTGDVVVLGAGKRVELWDRERFDRHVGNLDELPRDALPKVRF